MHPDPQLGHTAFGGSQAGRAPQPDRGEKLRGLRLQDRPASSDPHPGHAGPARHLGGRNDREPGRRGAAGGCRQPLPR